MPRVHLLFLGRCRIRKKVFDFFGGPVGNPAFYLRFSEEIVATVVSELEVLSRMLSLQSQHTIATKSTLHRVTHLLRNIPGGELEPFGPLGTVYDAAVKAVPARICLQLSAALPEGGTRLFGVA